ncbi:MAG: hypothetical protein ACRD1X_11950, partial [Vicinamibacteria bacterium]
MTASRWTALGVVMMAVIVSFVRFFTGTPSPAPFLRVAAGILLWFPIKGALLRFLGGARPYRSALAANASSELAGLGFPLLGLGVPWPALAASLVLSTGLEGLTFGGLRTAASWRKSLGLALYVNLFAHLLLVGVFLYSPPVLSLDVARSPQPVVGGIVILASFLLFILPI